MFTELFVEQHEAGRGTTAVTNVSASLQRTWYSSLHNQQQEQPVVPECHPLLVQIPS
jgi:hypothetical protein